MDIENLLCDPGQHSRKKSFHRHFEQKILKPKLALTFNKKIDPKDIKKKYARTGKNKKKSNRVFDVRQLKSKNLHKHLDPKDLFRGSGKKGQRQANLKKKELKIKKRNISSGKKMVDMFASQTINPARQRETRQADASRGNRAAQPKPKFSNRKHFQKTANLNQFGAPFKPKKSLFMDLDWLKKGVSQFKKDSMPPIPMPKRRTQPKKQARKANRREQRKAKEYNASCSNHDPESAGNFRVKLSSIKSYSKVDNSIAVDTFDKFFKIFKKKKQSKKIGEEKPNTSTPNIYKYPRSRFKSFRQLTMQRHSKRTVSRPYQKKREKSLDRVVPGGMQLADLVFEPKRKRHSNFYKKKIWPKEKANIEENIYSQQIKNGHVQKRAKAETELKQLPSRKIEGDVEKFHREYIKIDCMESNSGSDSSNFRNQQKRTRNNEFGEARLQSEMDFENERVFNFEHEMYKNNRKLKKKGENSNIYQHKGTDETNLSFDSQDESEEAGLAWKKQARPTRPDCAERAPRDRGSKAKSDFQEQKIKKVRLIDSYNLGFLYEHSSPKGSSQLPHSQMLKNILNQKRIKPDEAPKEDGQSEDSQKIVLENLSQDWNSDFQEGEQALDFIKIENGSDNSVRLENISLQKSISIAQQSRSPQAEKPFLYKNSFVIGKDEVKLSESERKPRNEESIQGLVNYESEKSFHNRFKKRTQYPAESRRKKTGAKRRSEHGIPLKMSSLRDKKLKMKLRRKADLTFPERKPAKLSRKKDMSIEGTFLAASGGSGQGEAD